LLLIKISVGLIIGCFSLGSRCVQEQEYYQEYYTDFYIKNKFIQNDF